MIKLDNELNTQILKLSKKFASLHPRYSNLYGGFEDYISELNYIILKNLNSYNKDRGALSTWCYTVFETKVNRDAMRYLKRKEVYITESLDQPINEGGDSFLDTISDEINYQEDIERKMFVKQLIRRVLPYISKDFMDYAIRGNGISELAKRRLISSQNMSSKIKREKIRLKAAIESNNFKNLKFQGENYDEIDEICH